MGEVRQMNVRLDEGLVERLKVIAGREGLSLNQLLQRVLEVAAREYEGERSVGERLRELEERVGEVERRLG